MIFLGVAIYQKKFNYWAVNGSAVFNSIKCHCSDDNIVCAVLMNLKPLVLTWTTLRQSSHKNDTFFPPASRVTALPETTTSLT